MTTIECIRCGAPIQSESGVAFCHYCGSKLPAGSKPPPLPQRKPEPAASEAIREKLRVLREQWESERAPLMDKGPGGSMLPPTDDFKKDAPFTMALGVAGFCCAMGFSILHGVFRRADIGWLKLLINPGVGFVLFFALPLLGTGIDALRKQKKKRIFEHYERLRLQYESERERLVRQFEDTE